MDTVWSIFSTMLSFGLLGVVLFVGTIVVLKSLRYIGETEVGLVVKNFSFKKLAGDNPIAFNGEAGYQSKLLKQGWRFKLWPLYRVEKHPWVQVPTGEIGIIEAQIGESLPQGLKTATYKQVFGNYSDACTEVFLKNGGQKGIQRYVIPPGTTMPVHPVAFLVITKTQVFGLPIDPAKQEKGANGELKCSDFGLAPVQLDVVRIEPEKTENGSTDRVGIVEIIDGPPLEAADIAHRLGGFADIKALEETNPGTDEVARDQLDAAAINAILANRNAEHSSYQDLEKFFALGGRMGMQNDPLLTGAYALNPFVVRVSLAPMLVVEQGQVAVVKSYVGLPSEDTSGNEFKHGSLVRPGHRGIWRTALRTGKYPLNPHIYSSVIVPTAILTLNWADATSKAHNLDKHLSQIGAKSCEGFPFGIDLQGQIHVPDRDAPKVISSVGTMENLVNEVLQAAVGNYFRDTLQGMKAVEFIQKRAEIQVKATDFIRDKLREYHVETRGIYIQDVVLPEELVVVLKEREIAQQEIATYDQQKLAQDARIAMEKATGIANSQAGLAQSEIDIQVQTNKAAARTKEAEGEANYIRDIGKAKGDAIEAEGLAKAKGYEKQVAALGQHATAMVNVATVLSDGRVKLVPDVLVNSGVGGSGLGAFEALAGTVIEKLRKEDVSPNATPKANGLDTHSPLTPSVHSDEVAS
jgi:hypothetical protein